MKFFENRKTKANPPRVSQNSSTTIYDYYDPRQEGFSTELNFSDWYKIAA